MDRLSERLAGVRQRIDDACRRARRNPDDVRLIAVSKTVSAQRIREALRVGQTLLGENRVQEAVAKIDEIGSSAATWHLVGHLQRNKARHAVGRFELLHGVDGEKLAEELDRRAEAANLKQAILLQVNLSGESAKSGAPPATLPRLMNRVAELASLELHGLMTIPPAGTPDEARRWFVELRRMRDRLAAETGLALPELSMGMTNDFEVAVEEGATLVRVGRAIFGERTP
ncbi:MAG: YggS family pyridoxal phosphate-dependent enzyme [bacterium]|nr:YggS family pyridoxal phosphate-dependent enzyme [bacterium]